MIVSFRLDIITLQGKLKLGQQRSDQDRIGVFKALNASPRTSDKELARFMNSWEIANRQS
jgi:predicted FMN-binding regulatory protein PaiB